jgi:hypothetical protein
VPIRAETDVRVYWFQGLLDGWVTLEGSTEDRAFGFVLQNAISSDACSYVVFGDLPRMAATERGSYVTDGRCDVTVTATALDLGDVFEGTFSAVVGRIGNPTLVTLTEGRFRAPRVPDGNPYAAP